GKLYVSYVGVTWKRNQKSKGKSQKSKMQRRPNFLFIFLLFAFSLLPFGLPPFLYVPTPHWYRPAGYLHRRSTVAYGGGCRFSHGDSLWPWGQRVRRASRCPSVRHQESPSL